MLVLMLFYYVSSHFFVIVELVNSEMGLTRFILCKAIPVLVAEVSMPTHCATSAGGESSEAQAMLKAMCNIVKPGPTEMFYRPFGGLFSWFLDMTM